MKTKNNTLIRFILIGLICSLTYLQGQIVLDDDVQVNNNLAVDGNISLLNGVLNVHKINFGSAVVQGGSSINLGFNNSVAGKNLIIGDNNNAQGVQRILILGNGNTGPFGNDSITLGSNVKTGSQSIGMGTAIDTLGGSNTFAMGNAVYITNSNKSMAIGRSVSISGATESIVVGDGSAILADADSSAAFGSGVYVEAKNGIALGRHVRSRTYAEVQVGSASNTSGFVADSSGTATDSKQAWHPEDPIFVVGNGDATTATPYDNYSNAMVVLKSGNIGIGNYSNAAGIDDKLDVDGIIHSKQGGIKFPDGTIQTTATTQVSIRPFLDLGVVLGDNTDTGGHLGRAAIGKDNSAGSGGLAVGHSNTAYGSSNTGAIAAGRNNTADGVAVAFGSDNYARSGLGSMALGHANTVEKVTASNGNGTGFAIGKYNTVRKLDSTAIGVGNTVGSRDPAIDDTGSSGGIALGNVNEVKIGINSGVALGNYNTVDADWSVVVGSILNSRTFREVQLGSASDTAGLVSSPDSKTVWNWDDPILVVGNGDHIHRPSNAMVILKNGNIGIGDFTNAANIDDKLNVDGVIHSTQGGIKFPDGTIQTTAMTQLNIRPFLDLGNVVGDNTDLGGHFARGAIGKNNSAGSGSLAIGYENYAYGSSNVGALAAGNYNRAQGSAIALGTSNRAQSGLGSLVAGHGNTIENVTKSNGNGGAIALGVYNAVRKHDSYAFGVANILGSSDPAITDTDSSGAVAIGTSNRVLPGVNSSVAVGISNTIDANTAVTLGNSLNVFTFKEVQLGSSSDTASMVAAGDSQTEWHGTDPLLVIGNGDARPGNSYADKSNAMVVLKNGNIGIGDFTSVADLDDKLNVDGVIHSTQGGIKFPDGTIQTTAASAVNLASFKPFMDVSEDGHVNLDIGTPGVGGRGAIGKDNSVGNFSLAVGQSNVAEQYALAVGSANDVLSTSLAVGTSNSLKTSTSFASGNDNRIENGSRSSAAIGHSNYINRSLYSAIFGSGNRITGEYAPGNVFGQPVYNSFVLGNNSSITNDYDPADPSTHGTLSNSFIIGQNSSIKADKNVVIGYNVHSANDNSTNNVAIGNYLSANSYKEIVLGSGTSGVVRTDAVESGVKWFGNDPVLVVGNGSSGENLGAGETAAGSSNAIVVLKNGNVGIGNYTDGVNIDDRLDVDGIIHTTQGGIKFPDGTIQTTAAVSGSVRPFLDVGEIAGDNVDLGGSGGRAAIGKGNRVQSRSLAVGTDNTVREHSISAGFNNDVKLYSLGIGSLNKVEAGFVFGGNNDVIAGMATGSNNYVRGGSLNGVMVGGVNNRAEGVTLPGGFDTGIVLGNGNQLRKPISTIIGDANVVGPSATEFAIDPTVDIGTRGAVAIGSNNRIHAGSNQGVTIGTANEVVSNNGITLGADLHAHTFREIQLGSLSGTSLMQYASDSEEVWYPLDPLLVVGNGEPGSASGASNAMVILKNGNIGIGNFTNVTDINDKLVVSGGVSSSSVNTGDLAVSGTSDLNDVSLNKITFADNTVLTSADGLGSGSDFEVQIAPTGTHVLTESLRDKFLVYNSPTTVKIGQDHFDNFKVQLFNNGEDGDLQIEGFNNVSFIHTGTDSAVIEKGEVELVYDADSMTWYGYGDFKGKTFVATDVENDYLVFERNSINVSETGGGVDIVINRVGSGSGELSLNYEIVSGEAISGTDYSVASSSGTVVWLDGETDSKVISAISIIDDVNFEGNEEFNIFISGDVGSITSAVVKIIDNDSNSPVDVTGKIVDKITQNGGNLSADQIAAVETFINSGISQGWWNKLYAVYGFVGGTPSAHAINWRNPIDKDDDGNPITVDELFAAPMTPDRKALAMKTHTIEWVGNLNHQNGVKSNGGYGNTHLNMNLKSGFNPDSVHMSAYMQQVGNQGDRIMGIRERVFSAPGTISEVNHSFIARLFHNSKSVFFAYNDTAKAKANKSITTKKTGTNDFPGYFFFQRVPTKMNLNTKDTFNLQHIHYSAKRQKFKTYEAYDDTAAGAGRTTNFPNPTDVNSGTIAIFGHNVTDSGAVSVSGVGVPNDPSHLMNYFSFGESMDEDTVRFYTEAVELLQRSLDRDAATINGF